MSVHSYIASFLEKNGYHKTLAVFKEEHQKEIPPINHGSDLDSAVIDKIKGLTVSKQILAQKSSSAENPWLREPLILHNCNHHKLLTKRALPDLNGLVIDCAMSASGIAICSTATRNLILIDLPSARILFSTSSKKSVIRKVAWADTILVLGYINGLIESARFDFESGQLHTLSSVQAHKRLIVDVKTVAHNGSMFVFSLGWDLCVNVYLVDKEGSLLLVTKGPQISSQGVCMEVLSHKEDIFVMVGKKENSCMEVLRFDASQNLVHHCQIALSDAEYATIKFYPMCIKAFSKNDVPLVAVATSHEPFMRVVLFSLANIEKIPDQSIVRSQISANFNTFSPQDKYSEACIAWNHDGTGIWIFGDDGIVRCLELKTGLIVNEFNGHEGRIKSLDSYSGNLLTCGIDRKVILWESKSLNLA